MTHRSSFEVVLKGEEDREYPVRFDFETAFTIEAAMGGMPPMQVIGALGTLSPSLSMAASILHAGLECYRKHHKSDHREYTVSQVRKALQEIGLQQLCTEIARPLAEVYNLFDEDAVDADKDKDGDAPDPTIAAPTGGG